METILGIDPDRGWALALGGKIISAGTVKGMENLKTIICDIGAYSREGRRKLLIRIERPKNLKTFPRPGVSIAVNMKISHNCGMNYQKATDLGEYCAKLGLRYEFVVPARRKLSAKEVREITGYQGRTSQHARDAIMLALRKGLPVGRHGLPAGKQILT